MLKNKRNCERSVYSSFKLFLKLNIAPHGGGIRKTHIVVFVKSVETLDSQVFSPLYNELVNRLFKELHKVVCKACSTFLQTDNIWRGFLVNLLLRLFANF